MNQLRAACLYAAAMVCAGRWIVAEESDFRTATAASENAPIAAFSGAERVWEFFRDKRRD